MSSCFLYSPSGSTPDADVSIEALGPRPFENVLDTLDPLTGARTLRAQLDAGEPVALPGPSVPADVYRWADLVEQRAAEAGSTLVDGEPGHRQRAGARPYVERYRRIDATEALSSLAGLAGPSGHPQTEGTQP
jgi:hypothetical protein